MDELRLNDNIWIDQTTYGTPTWIWSVVVDGRLFVRAYNGTDGRWYRSAIAQRAGRIDAAGATHDVAFAPADPGLADRIDQAYEEKYAGSPAGAPFSDATTEPMLGWKLTNAPHPTGMRGGAPVMR